MEFGHEKMGIRESWNGMSRNYSLSGLSFGHNPTSPGFVRSPYLIQKGNGEFPRIQGRLLERKQPMQFVFGRYWNGMRMIYRERVRLRLRFRHRLTLRTGKKGRRFLYELNAGRRRERNTRLAMKRGRSDTVRFRDRSMNREGKRRHDFLLR